MTKINSQNKEIRPNQAKLKSVRNKSFANFLLFAYKIKSSIYFIRHILVLNYLA
jgi:hypothetical protein